MITWSADLREGLIRGRVAQDSDSSSGESSSSEESESEREGEKASKAIKSVAMEVEESKLQMTSSGRKIKQVTSTPQKAPKKQKKEKVERDKNDWICGVCNLLEAADGTDLLFSAIHDTSDPNWLCDECATNSHACFVCKVKGVDLKDVFKCSVGSCGKFYHQECLDGTVDNDYLETEHYPSKSASTAKTSIETLHFKCPHHSCDTCFEFYGAFNSSDLTGCLFCPRAYHTNCISPGCRWNAMCLLCPDHPDKVLPSQDQVFTARTTTSLNTTLNTSTSTSNTSFDSNTTSSQGSVVVTNSTNNSGG
eukprot:gene34511-42559_t